MGRLYVVRHGQTDRNAQAVLQGPRIDSDLSDLGRMQAAAAGQALKETELDALYVSPMRRARQTADQIIAARPRSHLAVQVVPELYEFDYGDFAGRPLEEIEDEVEQIMDAWKMGYVNTRFPGGESPVVAQHRIRPSADRLRETAAEQDLLVVAHGRINRILLATLTGKGLEQMHTFDQSNCGITELAVTSDGVELVREDDTDHLDQKGPASFS